jgi:hypothetical protein
MSVDQCEFLASFLRALVLHLMALNFHGVTAKRAIRRSIVRTARQLGCPRHHNAGQSLRSGALLGVDADSF